MAFKYWPLLREGMEDEIAGKLANEAWTVVPRPSHTSVMNSRWVFDFKLGTDGSILKIKCRFVGCGLKQNLSLYVIMVIGYARRVRR